MAQTAQTEDKVAPYLIDEKTGEIYPYNIHIAKRPGMKPLDKLPAKGKSNATTRASK